MPLIDTNKHMHFDLLLALAKTKPKLKTAIVSPDDADALAGSVIAAKHGLIEPILIGDKAMLETLAARLALDISGFEMIDEPDHTRAAARAVLLVHEKRADAVMKGNLHTDILLGEIIKREGGLRTSRRLSHVFVMDVPGFDRLLSITDAAINIAPDLKTKADIVQNAIELAHAMGLAEPKVAILAAVEMVNPNMPTTLDAAALSKMADRGQITGGLVDGPFALDNAIDERAAKTKGIVSPVAGKADILVAPNLEAGNMMVKELTFLAHAKTAGLVLGAKCPIILTSRADDEKSRLASCAVAVLFAAHHL